MSSQSFVLVRPMTATAALIGLLWSGMAAAETKGVVIRADADGGNLSSPVVAQLTPQGGAATDVELKDDGQQPDVTAGDKIWSGAGMLDGDSFDVKIKSGGKTLNGGRVSWGADEDGRDLNVHIVGDSVTLEASVSKMDGGAPADGAAATGSTTDQSGTMLSPGGQGSQGGQAGQTGGQGGAAGQAGGQGGGQGGQGGTGGQGGSGMSGSASGGGSPTTPTGGRPSLVSMPAGQTDPTLYIALGVGVLLLAGIGYAWVRTRRAEGGGVEVPAGFVPLPEPGVLGDRTPSLSDGLQLWVAEGEAQAALVRPLLAHLARHHRVLFVAPSRINPPAVHGGPVYRAPGNRPGRTGQMAEALAAQGGNPLAVLIVGESEDPSTLKDYADVLPGGVGGIAVVSKEIDIPLARVTARNEGGAWVLSTSEGEVRARAGSNGFDTDDAA
ncbi:MAG: hypothetical protein ACOZNI_26030 [Myxococcota bacterium]